MAEPPEHPEEPNPTGDSARDPDGWLRPSQRRPRPGPRSIGATGATPDNEPPAAAEPRVRRPRILARRPGARDRITPPAAAPEAPGDATEAVVDAGAAPAVDDPSEPTATGDVDGAAASRTWARRARRRHARRRRRRALAGVGALVLLAGAAAGAVLASGGGAAKAAHRVRLAPPTTTTTASASPLALIATTRVSSLPVYDQPNGKVVQTLSAKTDYLLPRTLLASKVQIGWLQVLLPLQPNDSEGWVRASDVTTSTTDYAIQISLSQHHLWLRKAGTPVVDSATVIGTPKTPTPTGVFYVTDPVDLTAQPNGPYGAFAIGLSGYSNVLGSFDGGPPQIAVHGTPYPNQVGQDLSNGCVRVPSPVAVQIARLVPLGTPVVIQA
jgi:lipoprotein-anchoring transpeptidase ErfK/SrfK